MHFWFERLYRDNQFDGGYKNTKSIQIRTKSEDCNFHSSKILSVYRRTREKRVATERKEWTFFWHVKSMKCTQKLNQIIQVASACNRRSEKVRNGKNLGYVLTIRDCIQTIDTETEFTLVHHYIFIFAIKIKFYLYLQFGFWIVDVVAAFFWLALQRKHSFFSLSLFIVC